MPAETPAPPAESHETTHPYLPARPHVVILGAGFAGVNCAKSLKNAEVDITLVNKTNYHLFQPLLYQVAMSALPAGDIAYPVRSMFRKQDNLRFRMDEATGINTQARIVQLKRGGKLTYDYLVVAIGNKPSYFGNDHFGAHAPGLKTLQDAMRIRERILLSFEEARTTDLAKRKKYLTFVCVGGGPTGMEMAGAISEIGRRTMTKDFKRLPLGEIEVHLAEGADRVLPPFAPELSARAKRDLEKMGVNVHLNTFVTDVQPEHVILTHQDKTTQRLETVNVIWAAGNQALPLVGELPVETNRAGQAQVHFDWALPTDERVFVLGDAATLVDAEGKLCPGVAQTAIQGGKYVGQVIKERAPRRWRAPFVYFNKGDMATIGRARAVVQSGNLKLAGWVAWVMWLFVHIFYLIGWRNRASVVLSWMWYYFSFQPGSRILLATDSSELRQIGSIGTHDSADSDSERHEAETKKTDRAEKEAPAAGSVS